jgi:hypothetical protein
MRTFVMLLLSAFVGTAFASEKVARTIDLGTPGVLEALQEANPGHYNKVTRILEVAGNVSCDTLPQMLKLQFDAAAGECRSVTILTSFPAKRRIWFQLEDTAYVTNVVLRDVRGKLIPAK